MKKVMVVFKNEVITLITRPSFWVGVLGLPLVGTLIFMVVGAINQSDAATQAVSQVFSQPQDMRPEGYVDPAGILEQMPPGIPDGTFIPYAGEEAARAALQAGDISGFYIVAEDYISSGQITFVSPDFNPLSSSSGQSDVFTWALNVNLAGGDMLLASLVHGPLNVEETSLAPQAVSQGDNPLAYWAPYAITLLFYMLIMSSASLLLSNISKEKENRIMEVLLTSVTPHQLLTGKILGLGVVGLGQTALWLMTSYALLNMSGRTFSLSTQIHLPVSFIAWGLVYFLLGYAVYASLMAGVGALAPNLREASQATMVVMMPLLVPLFLSSTVFMEDPHGALATGLSLFPLSAPVAMMARLASGGVAWWQTWLAAILLVGTAVLIVRGVAGMFRAQALLSGQTFKVKTFLLALIGKM